MGTAQLILSVGALLIYLLSGADILIEDWKERLEGAARLCRVGPQMKTELVLSTLEGEA